MMLSTGVQYDDNISTGPDSREISLPDGGTVTLTERQKKLDDFFWQTKLMGDVRYDIGAPRGIIWDTKVNFFNSAGIDYSEFNITAVDISTGPWWVGPRDIVKIPVGYMDYDYGSDNLSETFHVDPSIEHFFNRFFSMQASYTFAAEDYSEEKISDSDSKVHKFSLGPNLYLQNRRHIISGYYTYEDHQADIARNSFDARNITLTYFTKLPVTFPKLTANPELFLYYRWFQRNYDAPPVLYSDDRKDRRNTFSATLSQRFGKHFFASLGYAYTRNNSNADLFDFEKNTYTFSVGVIF